MSSVRSTPKAKQTEAPLALSETCKI